MMIASGGPTDQPDAGAESSSSRRARKASSRARPRACAPGCAAERTGGTSARSAPARRGPGIARSNQRPRNRVMPWPRGSSAPAAVPPARTSTLGRDQRDVAEHERQARGDLRRGRLAVAGWPPIDDVGDLHAGCGRARSRPACGRAVGRRGRQTGVPMRSSSAPGASPMMHDRRRRVAVGEDRVGRGALQRAAVEPGDQRAECLDRLGFGGEPARRLRGSAERFGRGRRRRCRNRAGAARGSGADGVGSRRLPSLRAMRASRLTGSGPIASSAPISICQRSSASAVSAVFEEHSVDMAGEVYHPS